MSHALYNGKEFPQKEQSPQSRPDVVYGWKKPYAKRLTSAKKRNATGGQLTSAESPSCFEKNSELPEEHPDRKAKGRCVFLGDSVRDEHHKYAVFDELSAAPAAMEASKSLDAVSLFPGYKQEQSDARSAYIQIRLGGETTWVALPRERWPSSWSSFTRPV